MEFPRYWRQASQSVTRPQGRPWSLFAWGWSDESEEAAAACARERLQRQAEAVAAGRPLDRYGYAEGRPLREEVLGRPCEGTVLTRNGYGARILNTERVAFVDVDLPPNTRGSHEQRPSWLARVFGGRRGAGRPTLEGQLDLLRAALRPEGVSARVYETHSGLRLILTERLYDPTSRATQDLLASLGCDPLYMTLCKQQACFRARLSPKSWRCGLSSPVHRFPYLDEHSLRGGRAWVERYEKVCEPYATTKFLTTIGAKDVHAEVEAVLNLHDEVSRAQSRLPLA